MAGMGLMVVNRADWAPVVELVLNSVASPHTRRAYGAALTSFLAWYDGQGRPALNRAVVHAWKSELVESGAGAAKVNQHLAAVRKLVREAAGNGFLSHEVAGSIFGVAGVKVRGSRSGNWLTTAQARELFGVADAGTVKGKRDRAVLGLLIGCGLRRSEVADLMVSHIGQREGRWVLVDLCGKHGRIRSVALPEWVKVLVDEWTSAAGVSGGRVMRSVDRHGNVGERMSAQAVLDVVASCGDAVGLQVRPHDLRRTCAKLCRSSGAELEQIQFLLGHASLVTTERYLGSRQELRRAPNDGICLEV